MSTPQQTGGESLISRGTKYVNPKKVEYNLSLSADFLTPSPLAWRFCTGKLFLRVFQNGIIDGVLNKHLRHSWSDRNPKMQLFLFFKGINDLLDKLRVLILT